MSGRTPEEIYDLFIVYMRDGDIDSVLTLHDADADAAFANRAGEVRRGVESLREELAPFAAAKQEFSFRIKKVIQTEDIALVHNEWEAASPIGMSGYALEVARRQDDGSWRWLIGDPFTARG